MTKEQLEKTALFLLIVAAAIYVYTTYALQPELAKLREQAQQLQQRQEHLRLLRSYELNTASLQQEIQKSEADLAKLNKQIPRTLDKPSLIVNLYTIVKRHGAQAQSLSFDQVQKKSAVQEMGITLALTGAAENVLATIKDLQFGDTLQLSVQSVTMSADKSGIRAELKLLARAGATGSSGSSSEKPPYMNSSFGIDSVSKMFRQ